MMQLFHHPISACSRRVTMTLMHLGLEVESHVLELGKPESRAVLGRINPNRKVPVLVDGELVLWESHAIMQYVCDKTPGQTLYPTELAARADQHRWLHWVSAHLGPVVGPINFERLWKKVVVGPTAQPDAALIARYEGLFHTAMQVLDGHLAERTWMCGKQVSLSDLSIAATLMYAQATQLSLDAYPHVLAWRARVEALPAWQATEPARIS